jgi:hypothetical protein
LIGKGETSERFNLTGFDKDDKEKELEFNTQKNFVKKHSTRLLL